AAGVLLRTLPAAVRTTLQFAELAAATATFSNISNDSRTARILCRFSAFGATIGSLQTGSNNPIKLIAAFTGIGFDSTKLISINARYFLNRTRAGKVACQSAFAKLRHLTWDFIRCN